MTSSSAGRPQRWQTRAFISLLLAAGFALLAASGLVLYCAPSCGVARGAEWTTLGLSKDAWAAVHENAAWLVLLSGVWHLVLNWRPFVRYLLGRADAVRRVPRWEALAALALTSGLLAGSALGLPPFATVCAVGDGLQASWNQRLTGVAGSAGCDASCDQPLGPPAAVPVVQHGTGWGQLDLAGACERLGVPVPAAQQWLAGQGVAAQPDSSLKALGESVGLRPGDLAERLATAGPRTGCPAAGPTGSCAAREPCGQ